MIEITAYDINSCFYFTKDLMELLNVKLGDKIMFINNVDTIKHYFNNYNFDIKNEIKNRLGQKFKELKESNNLILWAIAKGEPLYYRNGQPIIQQPEQNNYNKQIYFNNHKKEIIEEYREDLIEYFGNLSDEELISKITLDMIEVPEEQYTCGAYIQESTEFNKYFIRDSKAWSDIKESLNIETPSASFFLIEKPYTLYINNGKYSKKEITAYIMLLTK